MPASSTQMETDHAANMTLLPEVIRSRAIIISSFPVLPADISGGEMP